MGIIIVGEKTDIQETPEGVSTFQYEVGKDSNLTLLLLVLGRSNAMVEATVRLVGEGAKVTIVGIIVGKHTSTVKLQTLQHHVAPETRSNLLVKSVLADAAKFFYDGGIKVEPKAQKTDAYQKNENLLLSKAASAESKPALEILANDVRCTHGATVGTVPKEQLWYLATRGIAKNQAQRLIVSGFLESAIAAISDIMVQQKVRKRLWQTLSKHFRFRQFHPVV